LPFLHAAERDGWHHLVTGDELWFSSMHHHVACGRYREIMWWQNRDMIFRAKRLCLRLYGIPAASMLSTDSQIIPKWTATILYQIYLFRSNKRSFLEEGRRMKDDFWFILTITQFTQVGFQQIGLKNTVFSACHTHRIHVIWPLVISTCFL
jgi:hypothetical protein